MRVLTVVAPGGDGSREAFGAALAEWNRGLDFRLRFLNIGVQEVVLVLPEGAGDPAAGLAAVEEAVAREAPGVAVLHGGGPGALAAAVSLAKAGVPVVRTSAGRRDADGGDVERAADRLAAVLFVEGAPEAAARGAEGLAGEPFTPGACLKAVIRLPREP